jgi:hypothetical protein
VDEKTGKIKEVHSVEEARKLSVFTAFNGF